MTAPHEPVLFQLFNEIGIIEQLSRNEFERVLPYGLSLASFTVLNHFVRLNHEVRSPSQLASALQVTKGAITNTLQRLETLGFVRLTPDPFDGRGKLVSATEAGLAAHRESIMRAVPILASISADFDDAELTAMLPTLRRLRAVLDTRRD